MRPLILSGENKLKAAKIVEYAEKPEHYYKPPADWVPGDQPEYTCKLDTFRCVFTITEGEGKRYRHLTISVPGPNLPNVTAAYTIATWFGFTGATMEGDVAVRPGQDWYMGPSPMEDENCVLIAQILERLPNCRVTVGVN